MEAPKLCSSLRKAPLGKSQNIRVRLLNLSKEYLVTKEARNKPVTN
jgi:hypothetical protein